MDGVVADVTTPGVALDASEPIAVARALVEAVSTAVRGKPEAVRLALTALLGGGHLLVQDLPGTGKTLLAKSIAAAIGGHFGRVQCTPDLLPSDITGTSIYQPGSAEWAFRPGPLFANVVLLDEINRASPRTQSALLEPMEEHQATVAGITYQLPAPFFCIATQNPHGQIGTFPLPESQLDRFALTLTMGLPGREAEREIVSGHGGVGSLASIRPVTTPANLAHVMERVAATHCDPAVVEYVLDLVEATRRESRLGAGVSPRVSVSLVQMARAHAVVSGRDYVTPDDVQFIFQPACVHRVTSGGVGDLGAAWAVLGECLASVRVPRA